MELPPTHHLAWSYKFALETLEALSVPNNDRAARLTAAIRCVTQIPTVGVPTKIRDSILELEGEFCRRDETWQPRADVIARNVERVRSWKKREQAIAKVIEVCVGLIETHAASSRFSRFFTDDERERAC